MLAVCGCGPPAHHGQRMSGRAGMSVRCGRVSVCVSDTGLSGQK